MPCGPTRVFGGIYSNTVPVVGSSSDNRVQTRAVLNLRKICPAAPCDFDLHHVSPPLDLVWGFLARVCSRKNKPGQVPRPATVISQTHKHGSRRAVSAPHDPGAGTFRIFLALFLLRSYHIPRPLSRGSDLLAVLSLPATFTPASTAPPFPVSGPGSPASPALLFPASWPGIPRVHGLAASRPFRRTAR